MGVLIFNHLSYFYNLYFSLSIFFSFSSSIFSSAEWGLYIYSRLFFAKYKNNRTNIVSKIIPKPTKKPISPGKIKNIFFTSVEILKEEYEKYKTEKINIEIKNPESEAEEESIERTAPKIPKSITPKLFSSSSRIKYENRIQKKVEKNNLKKNTNNPNMS